MDTLLAARAQMEVSLGFHMIFAALGIGMPLLLLIAEGLWLKTGLLHYRELAHQWAKATALTFAVGAVSGTALSFELGLLWPHFMEYAGATIGSAFTLEGFAFFIEAIFLGLYLYGWDRLSPRAHFLTGIPIAVSGLVSGILVVAVNSWMQYPALDAAGEPRMDPLAPFASPAWFHMSLHSSLSCYIATGFGAAGVYAVGLLRGRSDAYHRSALRIALAVAAVAAVLQPLSGDVSARAVAQLQPAKLAAMEALFETEQPAALVIGGWPDVDAQEVRYAIRIPRALSLLAHHDFNAEVSGLDRVPRTDWPNVTITHLAFQIMVGCGFLLAFVGLWFWLVQWRKREASRTLLWLLLAVAPLGFVALEAGWIVTEVGRQPWVINGVMRTADAVTPVENVQLTFYSFCILYAVLGSALTLLLRRLAYNRRLAHG
ncbi:MAG TPA: cytochrome ubiquinol oxidase subunit I [Longimicrobiales bacterium]|nr:cytochrome ubiquinol oxidase subunit I [Longimicrobiales bacterium]